MLLRISLPVAALMITAGLALAQQPKPVPPTPASPTAPATPTPPTTPPTTPTAAQPARPPVKLPAEIQRPRSQLQAEFAVASGDTVLFPYQGKDLTKRSAKILETQAAWLKDHADLPITLEAYCDDDLQPEPTRVLCTARANAVKAELVRLGVGADRFKFVLFLDAPPKKGGGATADGRKEEDKNRRNNRRVMTRIDA